MPTNWLSKIVTRALSWQQIQCFVTGPATMAGVAVSEELAVANTAILRALSVYSNTVAGLKVCVHKHVPRRGSVSLPRHNTSLLLQDPNDNVNRYKMFRTLVLHDVASGNGLAEIERASNDTPIGLHNLHWRNAQLMQRDDGSIYYHLQREGRDLEARDVIHLTGAGIGWNEHVGLSPIRAARESIGLGLAAERHASSVFGNGAIPRGILKTVGVPNPETKGVLQEAWAAIHGGLENANKIGFLGPGVDFIETNMTPESCQLLETRKYVVQEVARIFGMPENLLFSGTNSYNADSEGNAQWYQLGLKSLLESIEAEFDYKLLTAEERQAGLHIKFDVSAYRTGFRADVESCSKAVLTGLLTPNEARHRLGYNLVEDGDELLVPLNLSILSDISGNSRIGGDLALTDQSKPTAPVAQTQDVAVVSDTALNGAQIASLLEVIEAVTSGELPIESAKGILASAFPTISQDQVDAIVKPLVGFVSTSEPEPQKALPAPDAPERVQPAFDLDAVRSATRAALESEIAKALRRQQKSKPKDLAHLGYLVDALGPSYRSYAVAHNSTSTIEDYAQRWIDQTRDKEIATVTLEDLTQWL